MILLPHFDIPSGFRLGKIPQKFPFQGPVFFGLFGKVRLFGGIEYLRILLA